VINEVKRLSVVDECGANGTCHVKYFHPVMQNAINVCVVDLPGRQPNWFSSKSGSSDGISQSFTMPSRTLATVGRRHIGLRSFWIEVGGWILGIATTSANFQIKGKNPSLRDALKMAASG